MSATGRYFKGLRRPIFSTMKVSASSSVAKGFASIVPSAENETRRQPSPGRSARQVPRGTAPARPRSHRRVDALHCGSHVDRGGFLRGCFLRHVMMLPRNASLGRDFDGRQCLTFSY